MKAIWIVPVIVSILILGTLGFSQESHGSVIICDGLLADTTLNGNVLVPEGASCELFRVTVNGNISAVNSIELRLRGVTVNGNINANALDAVNMQASGDTTNGFIHITDTRFIRLQAQIVNGDVKLTNNHPSGSLTLRDNFIDGNVKLSDNHKSFTIRDNVITKNLKVIKNIDGEIMDVFGNDIGENLMYKNNIMSFRA